MLAVNWLLSLVYTCLLEAFNTINTFKTYYKRFKRIKGIKGIKRIKRIKTFQHNMKNDDERKYVADSLTLVKMLTNGKCNRLTNGQPHFLL